VGLFVIVCERFFIVDTVIIEPQKYDQMLQADGIIIT